jgi:hypothetical protein
MCLTERTNEALDGIANFTTGTRNCPAQQGRRQLACELAALDKLACSVSHLQVATDELANATIDELRALADGLSGRLTYLLEPIAAVEIDSDRCVVQLRSVQPSREAGANSYYELMVHRGGAIALERFSAEPGQPRRTIPAQFTRQVLSRLIGDFEAVLDDFS